MKQNKIVMLLAIAGILLCGGIWLYQGKSVQTTETIVSEETNDGLSQQTTENEDGRIYIHIVGAVKKPGVYTFQKKPRVIEVVEKAGGFTKDAVTTEVNQAEVVEDGTQLTIASQKDSKEKKGQQAEQVEAGKVNLNTATKEQLMTLSGIGEAKAVAIIAYREEKGKFHKTEDLMNITGIKEGVFDKIKSQICV